MGAWARITGMGKRHSLVVHLLGGRKPGDEVVAWQGDIPVARSYFSAPEQVAVLMLEPGRYEIRRGHSRAEVTIRFTMPNRDAMLGTEKMKLTPDARLMLRIRNMTHRQRIEYEWGLDA